MKDKIRDFFVFSGLFGSLLCLYHLVILIVVIAFLLPSSFFPFRVCLLLSCDGVEVLTRDINISLSFSLPLDVTAHILIEC